MQKILLLSGLLLFIGCVPKDTVETLPNIENTEGSNTNDLLNPPGIDSEVLFLDRSKRQLLAYFDELVKNEQLIVGQHCGNGPDDMTTYYNRYVDMLADISGRHVGLMGADLGFFPSSDYPVQSLIDHWNQGGLVTLSWHADNPFVEGYNVYWNTVENKGKINLKSLLKGEVQTKAWINYRTELDQIAGALQKLQDAGVTVIWRPFHEMNGDFFWWGINAYNNQQTNEADFIALWRDLYHTLTFDYGLDNLIWVYSVIPYQYWNAEVTTFYPGNEVVDLVGMDFYGSSPDFPDYKALKSLGKTLVLSESGPLEDGYGNWNMMQWADMLKGKAAYFLQWHSWSGAEVAIIDNANAVEMMNSTIVITRDEL
ncbi:hypothetical protein FK220_009010 [Flavobacteriaceae bacterium TP-CH-4]|uniref:GH26 domain-containing protein n=1 Tax=Pelagihabitans pacificus TaxID=2696054 RepID=A0A967EDM1_9FLAO|nr:glycosyl hydrolase [Pelagihabitans pacificus]NHF59478.1 hypothetical protein [Pelagihabitans pacificus]